MKYILYLFILSTFFFMSCKSMQDTEIVEYKEEDIDSLIQIMTLEEKMNMIHASSSFTSGGVERLGIPELVMSDGPHGIRHEHGRDWVPDDIDTDSVSYLPTGIALAATWNEDLGYKYGEVLGNEAKSRGKDVLLGPGININRSPLNGRNFEYLGEDPFLAAKMAVGYVKGVQDQGVAACAKHYVANNQETLRKGIDVQLDERALREIYLPSFKAVVDEADVWTIMGAYNKVRGQYCSHNEYLVNQVLKEEYGFEGLMISDWGAVWDTREAIMYGTDIEMGTDLVQMPDVDYNKFYLADPAFEMVKSEPELEKFIDDKVRRILRINFRIKKQKAIAPGKVNTREHHELARKVAEESIVLLKNDGLFPLNKEEIGTLAVIGSNARTKHGELGGSSQVKTLYEITPYQGIANFIDEDTKLIFAEGYRPNEENAFNEELAREAIEVASKADVVVFVGGWIHNLTKDMWNEFAYDCEGRDKVNLKLMYGQDKLIRQLAEANKNLAVVIIGGSQVEMNDWLPDVKVLMQAWYPGMEGGNALANLIFGKVNPSGKLPVSFANTYLDYPSHIIGEFPGQDSVVHYKEGIMVGYRYFSSQDSIQPVFPFGHGLSYTKFDYSNLKVSRQNDLINVELTLSNTGEMDGKEVVQCYISKNESEYLRPGLELKQFEKVQIPAGETVRVGLQIPVNDLRIYDEEKSQWILEPGAYRIHVGASSGDIRLEGMVEL